MLYELLNAFDPREMIATAADLLSDLRDKIMPPRLSRRKCQWPRVLEALKPARLKVKEITSVGIENVHPTLTTCEAGWIAVYTKGFVISAKKITHVDNVQKELPPGQIKESRSIFCHWYGRPPIGFVEFWETTWAAAIFEGTVGRRENAPTFEQDTQTWLQDANQKVMRQTRQRLELATKCGRFDLVAKCAEILKEIPLS